MGPTRPPPDPHQLPVLLPSSSPGGRATWAVLSPWICGTSVLGPGLGVGGGCCTAAELGKVWDSEGGREGGAGSQTSSERSLAAR